MSIEAAFIVPHPPLIVPAVGRGEERKIQDTVDSYHEVARRIARIAPDTIVLTSPHATLYRDYFHVSPGTQATGDLYRFHAYDEKMTVPYDQEFSEALSRLAMRRGFPAGTEGEREPELDHGTYIPLHFVNEVYTDYRLVRIGLSGLSPLEHYELGILIAQVTEQLGRKVVFIASGDLSHVLKDDGPYGFEPEGPRFDAEVTAAMDAGDFMRFLTFDEAFCDNAAECGLRSFQIMAGALDGKAVTHELLSYEGPFGVGYGVAAFEVQGEDATRHFGQKLTASLRNESSNLKDREDPYVQLARLAVETYIRTRERAVVPAELPAELMERRAGVFVSIKKHHRLRGCIGTIQPARANIAEEIIDNAISACSRDPRFMVVQPHELPDLVYSVDVLGEPEPVGTLDELDVHRYGVIVSGSGGRGGLVLPGLEGVDTVEEQVDIARRKADISEGELIELERFEVVRHP